MNPNAAHTPQYTAEKAAISIIKSSTQVESMPSYPPVLSTIHLKSASGMHRTATVFSSSEAV